MISFHYLRIFLKRADWLLTDALLTFAALCLFVVDVCGRRGLCLLLWRWGIMSVISIAKSSFGKLFWLKKEKTTLSPPSVLRVLFMISSRRWWTQKREEGISLREMPQRKKANNRTVLYFCKNILSWGLVTPRDQDRCVLKCREKHFKLLQMWYLRSSGRHWAHTPCFTFRCALLLWIELNAASQTWGSCVGGGLCQ